MIEKQKPAFAFRVTTALMLLAVLVYPWPGFAPADSLVSAAGYDAGFLIPFTGLLILVAFISSFAGGFVILFRRQPSIQFWLESTICLALALTLPAYWAGI